MKIISWNVNSVRARIEKYSYYIKDSKPDVLLLQEIKTQEVSFPRDTFKISDMSLTYMGKKVTMV
jgi:exodeoxyribonuclease-3